jgi:hypothetical protein
MPGSVWSIKGYQRDILAGSKKIQDSIETFLGKIEAKSVANKDGVFYCERLGKFSLSTYRKDTQLLTIRQSGSLGNLILKTDPQSDYSTSFNATGEVHMSGTFGTVSINDVGDRLSVAYTSGGQDRHAVLYRPRNDSPVVSVISEGADGVAQAAVLGSPDKYNINGISFYTTFHANNYYMKIGSAGKAPSQSEIDHAFSDAIVPQLNTAVVTIGDVQTTIDINNFKNVGRRQYRVNSVAESEYGKYSIKASEYNRDKFDIIEKSLNLNRPSLPIPPQQPMDIPLPPSDLKVKDVTTRDV